MIIAVAIFGMYFGAVLDWNYSSVLESGSSVMFSAVVQSRKRKILFLGAAHFQLPAIRYAVDAGYDVITCDNKPSNPGHAFAVATYNVSTSVVEDVARIAADEQVNGIVAFGSDVGVRTAAQVCSKLGLPTPSPAAVDTLTNKRKFRELMATAGLQKIAFETFHRCEAAKLKQFLVRRKAPKVLKPVDSAGSKGVCLICSDLELDIVIERAFAESILGEIIVEDYVPRVGYQVCGDGYIEAGRLCFVQFGDGHFYDVPRYMAPIAETFPSSHSPTTLQELSELIEATLLAAGYRHGVFNVDALITSNNRPFILEIGPRSGGNFIPVAIYHHTGVNLVEAAVELALDPSAKVSTEKHRGDRYHACYMLHSKRTGVLDKLELNLKICEGKVIDFTPYAQSGDYVKPFTQANFALGNVVVEFPSFAKMHEVVAAGNDKHFRVFLSDTDEFNRADQSVERKDID
jgi:biotin carboxylase